MFSWGLFLFCGQCQWIIWSFISSWENGQVRKSKISNTATWSWTGYCLVVEHRGLITKTCCNLNTISLASNPKYCHYLYACLSEQTCGIWRTAFLFQVSFQRQSSRSGWWWSHCHFSLKALMTTYTHYRVKLIYILLATVSTLVSPTLSWNDLI